MKSTKCDDQKPLRVCRDAIMAYEQQSGLNGMGAILEKRGLIVIVSDGDAA